MRVSSNNFSPATTPAHPSSRLSHSLSPHLPTTPAHPFSRLSYSLPPHRPHQLYTSIDRLLAEQMECVPRMVHGIVVLSHLRAASFDNISNSIDKADVKLQAVSECWGEGQAPPETRRRTYSDAYPQACALGSGTRRRVLEAADCGEQKVSEGTASVSLIKSCSHLRAILV